MLQQRTSNPGPKKAGNRDVFSEVRAAFTYTPFCRVYDASDRPGALRLTYGGSWYGRGSNRWRSDHRFCVDAVKFGAGTGSGVGEATTPLGTGASARGLTTWNVTLLPLKSTPLFDTSTVTTVNPMRIAGVVHVTTWGEIQVAGTVERPIRHVRSFVLRNPSPITNI